MKDITTAESVYLSLKAMERAVQAFADVADDWCEDEDPPGFWKFSPNIT
jgi:predicted CopG family antitoxin